MKRTGGKWDARAWPSYFVAGNIATLKITRELTPHTLIAVNELKTRESINEVYGLMRLGQTVLIDSGVFWLSTQHAKKHDLTMDEALALAPDEVDNFGWLFDRYVSLIREMGHLVWGYIEIDQGGRENKIKTRAKLEALGLRPMPVYHPFNDGWDYFDELAQGYDRICFGNVVQADPETRKRLVATAWERRQKYPHLWIHILGLTPNERSVAYPLPSSDSSTWLAGSRWGAHNALVANKRCWSTGRGFIYDLNADEDGPTGHKKAWRLGGYEAHMAERIMRATLAEQAKALGYKEDFWKGEE